MVTITIRAANGSTTTIVLPAPVVLPNFLIGNAPGDHLLDLQGNRILAK